MKNSLFCCFVLATGLTLAQAQESAFEVLLPYTTDYSYSFCSETLDGHFLVVPGRSMIVKLSQQGDIVGELYYSIEDADNASTRISTLLDIPDDPSHHIAIAESYKSTSSGVTSNLLHVFKFDDELQYDPDSVIVVDLSQEVQNYALRFNAKFTLSEDGSVCFASNARKWDGSNCLMFTKVTTDGTVTTRFDNQFCDHELLQVCYLAPNSGHYDMVVGHHYEYRDYLSICEVSYDFETSPVTQLSTGASATTLLQYDNLADSLCLASWRDNDNCAMAWLNDSVFLLPTEIFGGSHYSTNMRYGAGIWKLDTDLNILKFAFFDVYDAPGNHVYKQLEARNPIVTDNGEVYFSYTTYKGSFGSPRQVAVCKLDTDLNLTWKRWYGGEQEYHLILDLILTSDGGCLLSGLGGPDPSYWTHPYPYVLKITPDGYCAVEENEEPLLKPYCFFPNPVGDVLHMEYSPDVTPARVELLDLQGRPVRSQTTRLESVSTEGLAAGAYTLRVTLEGGKAFTDKVVKQ